MAYIEREALFVEIEKMAIVPEDLYDYGILAGVNAVREALGHIPDADVVPVVHGRWVPTPEYDSCWCSCCKKQYTGFFASDWNYCPNCGARMKDGE